MATVTTSTLPTTRTAEQIYTDLSTYYKNKTDKILGQKTFTWDEECDNIGNFKEGVWKATDRLYYCPLYAKEITLQALEQIKTEFEAVKNRLEAVQKELAEFHPVLKEGIAQIKATIIAPKEGLAGLDTTLPAKAATLTEIAKVYLHALELDEEHVAILHGRIDTRFAKDAMSRWETFCTEYNKHHLRLDPLPPEPGMMRRFGAALSSYLAPASKEAVQTGGLLASPLAQIQQSPSGQPGKA